MGSKCIYAEPFAVKMTGYLPGLSFVRLIINVSRSINTQSEAIHVAARSFLFP